MDDAAINNSYWLPASDWNAVRPVARTLIFSLLVTNNGHRKAFQEFIPTNIDIVIIDGFAIGTKTFHKNFQSPAPSILAA